MFLNNTGIASVNSSGVITGVIAGSTTIDITVTFDGVSISKTINVTLTNDGPVITGPSFTEIAIGTPLNPMTGITATDTEDRDLTGAIIPTGAVNSSVAGVYTIVYSVTDLDGNTTTKTRVVLVNDGTYQAGNNFIIKADNFTKRISQVDTSDAAIKTAAGVKVYSKATGDLIAQIQIDNPVNTSKAGVYKVTYTVQDRDFNKVIKTQIVLINHGSFIINEGYAIKGQDFTLKVSEVNTEPYFLIHKGQVQVFDLKTGELVENPSIIVDASNLRKEPGRYKIFFTFNPTLELTVTVILDDSSIGKLLPSTRGIGFFAIAGLLVVAGFSLLGFKGKNNRNKL